MSLSAKHGLKTQAINMKNTQPCKNDGTNCSNNLSMDGRPVNDQQNSQHPLAEVFGYPSDDMSASATKSRQNKLCPYNNNEASVQKIKKINLLVFVVCSIMVVLP